ncbi:unnamed protein product [Cuscuta epithymum]|uniref:Uncharacterized protein n=1 Tax=Cuscuta epithymum TaxID=186058 RepID=A0AAV0EH66_9ASTE|nr:unnamed protein product [Cuscuta epithymum]
MTPTNEGDSNKTGVLESGDRSIRSRHAHSRWDFPDLTAPLACEGCYDIPDFTSLGDEFIGHVSKNKKRVPISTEDDLWDSYTNDVICKNALLVTRENCLPTQNMNTQKGIYKKKN